MAKKKGQVLDMMYIVYILFMIAVVSIFAYIVVNAIRVETQDSNMLDSNNVDMISSYETKMAPMSDQLFMLVLIGASLIAIISAFFVMSHPIVYIFMVILLSILTFVNAIYANVYEEIVGMNEISLVADQFKFIPFVMRWFPLVMLVISIVIAIVMSAKR